MIKKLLYIFIALIISTSHAFAVDYSSYCAEPYDLSWGFTRFLNNATGTTAFAQTVANSVLKNELKKATGTKGFKVKMKTFSAKDLTAGRFKSLTITGEDLNFDGIYVSKLNAKTVCKFNYIKATTKDVTFKENFVMDYDLTVTNDDLKKSVLSKNYLAFLNSLNMKAFGINLFELKDVDVKLVNDKFHFVLKMNNKLYNFSMPLNIELSSKMRVENGKIKATEVTMENLNHKVNLTKLTNLLNTVNPLNFTVDVMGNKNSKLALNTLDIKGDKLVISGSVLVPKNTSEKVK